MALITSDRFCSSAASGKDWRDIAKAVLEDLQDAPAPKGGFNFGFLYFTDPLSGDAKSLLNLFREILGIEHWIGCNGLGVCANGGEIIDEPAVSVMLARFEEEDFCLFGPETQDNEKRQNLMQWLEKNDPMLVFTHGDPMANQPPDTALRHLSELTQGFIIGGLSSSRSEHFQIAGKIYSDGLSGAAFSPNIQVATTLSQGCNPIGEHHVITRGEDHIIFELDGQPAGSIFEKDLHKMAYEKIGVDPDEIEVEGDPDTGEAEIPEELQTVFTGEVCIGFPVQGSDGRDMLVRNIMSVNEDGSILVSHSVTRGDEMVFVHRDDETVKSDLAHQLVLLRKRIEHENNGLFVPKGAIYISCAARAFSQFKDGGICETSCGEMDLIRDIIGDIPLTGFYAGGEINHGRLYGYTGILLLFL